MNDWLSADDLKYFKNVGRGVCISKGARVFGAQNIQIGDNVRIDTGAVILASAPGGLRIGSNVHIAAHAILSAGGGIEIGSYCTVGFGSKLVSASDSFAGDCFVGPVFPDRYTKVKRETIVLERHAIVTTDCTLLPGAIMREGSVLGAMSLLKGEALAWHIHAGIPAKPLRERKRDVLKLAEEWETEWALSQRAQGG